MAASRAEPTSKVRILVVDDHPMVRHGLIGLINQEKDLMCCGEAGTVGETLAATAKNKPDLVILDLRLKDGDGLELIKSLKSQLPELRILILSQYEAPIYIERALRAGALGYLSKDQAAADVLRAVRTVVAGQVFLSAGTAALQFGFEECRIEIEDALVWPRDVDVAFAIHRYSASSAFAARVKTDWNLEIGRLIDLLHHIRQTRHRFLRRSRR